MKRFFLLLLLFLLGIVNPVLAQGVYQAHTHVRLISDQDAVAPGRTFWVGIDFKLDDKWHVYWRNPGDAGLAPKVKWDLPPGMKAGDIRWPYPERIVAGPLTSYGYEHEVLLLVPISVSQNFQPSTVKLHARLDWLACWNECIPGKADLNLPIAVVKAGARTTFNGYKGSFDQTRQNLPQVIPSITSQAKLEGNRWHLDIKSPLQGRGNIVFYPYGNNVIKYHAAENTQKTSHGYRVILTKSHFYQGNLTTLDGIAVNPAGWQPHGAVKAIVIKAPIEVAPPQAGLTFVLACLFALIGGLILNLMPCVLPVLSIKVMHLIERHPDKRIAFHHSMLYSLGILVSMWALALLLFMLKAAGEVAGWGFQFQSPVFVLVVAVILFILALSLFGVFEFSAPSLRWLPVNQTGYGSSFVSGIITTVVATPCTAPFMGTALAAAISQPNIVGLGIFTFLGLGLALPFVLLSAFPALLSFVPKPGRWMIILKRGLGVILVGCVIWLIWVFGIQTGFWSLPEFHEASQEIHWQSYSASAVNRARQTKHGVFVDFTAAWCLTCQVNDRLVLQNSKVVQAFKAHSIIAFKADWTKYDPAITRALALLGRDSVPVYVYYPPGAATPVILPQIITPKIILERINH
jgi:thiol:disulfide interchange protein/DsbC/DsbD-like thiol-disulfide interchange protein